MAPRAITPKILNPLQLNRAGNTTWSTSSSEVTMHVPLYFLAALLPAIQASPLLQSRAGPAPGTVITKCTNANQIALTFDDGPYNYEASLVQKLNAAGAKATFFVTGTLYNCIYSQRTQLKATYAAGHQIASHTWTHANLANLGASQITTEMQKLEAAFSNILGVKPTYMRPPNGATGGQVVNTLKSMGYRIVTWDVDSGDWNNQSPQSSLSTLTNAGTGSGHIILMHETVASTPSQLADMVINYAKSKNLKMVTVAECVGDSGGAYTTASAPNGATSC